MVTANGWGDASWVVQGVVEAVENLATEVGIPDGRVRPLIALPLVGTGDGGFARRRGALILALLPALRRLAAQSSVDVALVLRDNIGPHLLRWMATSVPGINSVFWYRCRYQLASMTPADG